MLVFLSTPTFDPTGFVELEVLATSKLGETRRRVNRIATLDGGAVVNDFGHTEADRTISLVWSQAAASIEANIVRLVQSYQTLQVATRDGIFLAAPETYTPGAETTLSLLVLSKLST